ncbi:hypothetical protein DFH06DRAFT_1307096, partial [Mycena polygramma]
MPSLSRVLFIATLFLSVTADSCGDNGGAELGWCTQADADSHGPRAVLDFSSQVALHAAGVPILSVITTNTNYAFSAYICGQANPDSYPQTTYGCPGQICIVARVCVERGTMPHRLPLGGANATVSLRVLPCINDISTPPLANQTFEWIGTDFITYGFAFLGTTSGLPLDPS